MAKIGSLFIDLGMNTARFEASVKSANSSVNRFKKSMNKSMRKMRRSVNRLGGSFTKMGATITAIAGPAALGLLVKSSFETADALAKTADKLGITTEGLAGLQQAAQLTGVSQQLLSKSLVKQQKAIADAAKGVATYKDHFDTLGLSTDKLMQMSPEKQFAAIGEELTKLTNSTQKTAIAYDLFGSRGTDLINTLALGKQGLSDIAAEAKLLNVAMSRFDTAKIEAANDDVFKATSVFKGLGNTIATRVAPFISAISKSFLESAKNSNGFKDSVDRGMRVVINSVGFVADAFRGLKAVFTAIQVAFGYVAKEIIGGFNLISQAYISLRKFLDKDYEPPKALIILNDMAVQAGLRYGKLKNELTDLVSQPMPSDNIRKWADEATAAADKVAQKVAASKAQLSGGSTPQDLSVVSDTTQSAKELEALGTSMMTQEQKLQESYLNRSFIIENAFQDELINEQRRSELLTQIETDKQTKLSSIQKNALDKRKRQEQVTQSAQLGIVSNALGAIASTMNSGNKKQFAMQKKLGIASALINTYKAISESLGAYPWPFNTIAAAAAGALGFAQVKAIQSQSFGGGGSRPSVSTGGNIISTPTPGQPPENPLAPNNNIEPTLRVIELKFPEDRKIFNQEDMRDFAEQLADGLGDMGTNVVVQAQ